MFITGDNGNGKSMLAAAVAMRLIDEGVAALFVNAAIQSQLIRNGFDRGGGGLWERMCEAPALVIDDLGKGKPTEWDCSMWYTVAEARNAARLPTVTTSNYDGGELIERLTVEGDDSTARAIVSRLRGGAVTVKTSGQDLRLSGMAARDGEPTRDGQAEPRRRAHRCPDCGGMMRPDELTGYVSDCPWCGCSMVFKSDLDACSGTGAQRW